MLPTEPSGPVSPDPWAERLESWKEIADYLGKGVTTVRRWEREEGLPVRRQEHLKRGSIVAYRQELDAWLQARTTPLPEEPPAPPPSNRQPIAARPRRFARVALTVAATSLVSVLAVASAWRPAWNQSEVGVVPLTSTPGTEGHIAFGPGAAYAYTHDGVEVLVHAPGSETGKVIWKPAGKSPRSVSWSPDGNWLAISQATPGRRHEFIVVTPDGKPVAGPFSGGPELTWSPDSQAVIYASRVSSGPSRIYERRLADGRTSPLSFPPEGSWGDLAAAISQDGQRMAIVRYGARGNGDVYLSAPGSRAARRLTRIENWINGVDWLPDGRHLVAGTSYAGRVGLFRLDTAEGQPQPALIERTEGMSTYPRASVQPNGDWRIGYSVEHPDVKLTVFDSFTGQRWTAAPSPYGEESPAIGDDGALVFNSNRKGGHELWVCPARDCVSPRRITRNQEEFLDAMPRWSPDGRRIAFAQRVQGSPSVLVMDSADGGAPPRVLSTGFQEGSPAWSADGRTVFFRSNRGGSPQIWRIAADGGGTPEQVTRTGGVECYATPDGQSLLYLPASDAAPLTRLSLRDGSLSVIGGLPPLVPGRWTLTGDLIYFLGAGSKGDRLHRFDLASGQLADIHSGEEVEWPVGIGANRAGLVVWSSRGPLQGDLVGLDLRPRGQFRLGGWF